MSKNKRTTQHRHNPSAINMALTLLLKDDYGITVIAVMIMILIILTVGSVKLSSIRLLSCLNSWNRDLSRQRLKRLGTVGVADDCKVS